MRKLTTEEIGANRVSREGALAAERLPIIGMLDNIRSLYNVGSIFRTSDGAFIRHLYLAGYTPRPPRKEIEKTALGATETVPWTHFADPLVALQAARETGARICGQPLALANALRKLHTASRILPMEEAKPASAHLFIVNPLTGGGLLSLFSTHPPMEERIARLEDMARGRV